MKKGARIVVILIVVLVVVAAGLYFAYTRFGPGAGEGAGPGFSLFGRPPGQSNASDEQAAVPVAVTAAARESARETLLLYGSVYAQQEVSIFTTVNGKISEVRVREGDAIRKGQVLALIDRDQAGLKFAPAEVTSTISGTVKDVLTEVGATVNPAAPLFQIADMDVVEVVVYVPEKKISRVRAGQEVEIKVVAYPERVFSGTVARLSPVVDPASRTLETRIRVVNRNHALKPGMFAEARIVLRQLDSAVTIPLAALVDKEGEQVAFVVNQDTVHEVRPVIAFVEGEKAVIENGVEAGDQVVVIGQQSLSDGDEVAVAEEKE